MSFTARHESRDADAAAWLLEELETFRSELEGPFDTTPGEVVVVVHDRPTQLALAHPWLPLARLVTAPASRRYLAGWFAEGEIHVLSRAALEARASGVPGSLDALLRSPRHEYAHLVVGHHNPALPPPFTPRTFSRYLQWAWLCEGAATHFSGQTPYLRAALARRLREGPRPSFPPSARDAPLLGGTVFGLLEEMRGPAACVALVARLAPNGDAEPAIEAAFGAGRHEIERAWQASLERFTSGR